MADEISEIIQSSVQEFGGGDDAGAVDAGSEAAAPTESGGETLSTDSADPDKAPAPAEQPDELLTTEFKGNKFNRLPYNRVKAIVENARKKAAEESAAALAEHQRKIQQYETAAQTWQREQQELREMARNPEQFLRALSEASPAYKELVERALARQEAQQPPQANIEPDVVLPDGSFGYSNAAAERLYQQRLALAEQSISAKIAKQFEPIVSEFQARKAYEEMVPRVKQQLAEAQKWPLFSEHQEAIRVAMEADRRLSLESAYRQVVFPKLQSDRDKMRAEILAEINGKAKAATSPSATPAAPPPGKAQSIDEIIREAVRKAG